MKDCHEEQDSLSDDNLNILRFFQRSFSGLKNRKYIIES